MEFERRNYPELPQPSGAFHHSVRSGNTLYIAGRRALISLGLLGRNLKSRNLQRRNLT